MDRLDQTELHDTPPDASSDAAASLAAELRDLLSRTLSAHGLPAQVVVGGTVPPSRLSGSNETFFGIALQEPGDLPQGVSARVAACCGRITQALLGLDVASPLGHPAFLLPLVLPAARRRTEEKVLVTADAATHDDPLKAQTGCDAVLRPQGLHALVDRIAAARFVLTDMMEAAAIAAAYAVPFGFWLRPGTQPPLPWRDLVSALGAPAEMFHARVPAAAQSQEPARLPPLLPLLDALPVPVHPALREQARRRDAGAQAAPDPARGHGEAAQRLIERRYSQAVKRAHVLEWQVSSGRQVPLPAPRAAEDAQAAAQLPVLQARLEALQQEHDLIARSTAWRLGRRARRLAQSHPRAARTARRALKLAWWTATFRLGERMFQRRDAQRSLALLSGTALFDRDWYLSRYASQLPPGTDPVMHYYWIGAQQGLDPHPLFSGAWYLAQLAAPTRLNPLVHYLTGAEDPEGVVEKGEGADPHPLFDGACYRAQLAEPLPAGVTPLEHFLAADPAALAAPNDVFTPAWYREEYLRAAPEQNPLVHYVTAGEAAGLFPHPLFDPVWYAARHDGASAAGPLAHYLRGGGREAALPCSAAMQDLRGVERLPVALDFPCSETPEVSIILPVYGRLHETWRSLAAVLANTSGHDYEVIVADDRPSAPVAPSIGARNVTLTVNGENLGFLANCNAASRQARGRYLLFLNSDTVVQPGWLGPMIALMTADPRVGAVGCKLLNPDGSVQEAGGIIYSNGWGDPFGKDDRAARGCYNYVREVDVVTGACFVVRRALFDALGGFDRRYAPAFYEEFDLVTALRDQGHKVMYQPASVVKHYGSASYGIEMRDRQTKRNHAKFCEKWRTLLAAQPAPDTPYFLARERPSPRGVILVIDDKVPEYDKHAGAVTLFQYLQLLREMGFRVIYHPQDGKPLEPYTHALQSRGIEVLHAPDQLDHWLAQNGCFLDYVWCARPDVAYPILDLLHRTTGAAILYYTHDLHYLREGRRWELDGNDWALQESRRLKPIELDIFARVDHVMTPSAEEAEIIRAEVPQASVTVVPPYLFPAADIVAAPPDLAARGDLVFVGGFDHTPNVDAALWLASEIMPLVWDQVPEATLWIVGNVPPDEVRALAGPRVQVTGFVPELAPYYARARVSINPLRYGAGVKGKIVGALQAGIPVVTTPCGNEGIQLRHGVEALIAEDAPGLAAACIALLRDADRATALAAAGIDVVRTRFSADQARKAMLSLTGDKVCAVCGIRPRQALEAGNADWRELTYCRTCSALNRSGALAQVLVAPYRRHRVNSVAEALPLLAGLRIHEFGADGAVLSQLRALSGVTCSEYLDGVRPGETGLDGTRCEDIQALSFGDASVDLFVSQDVMEHVADPWAGFAEIHRCLKPGGRHVFTIPYQPGQPATMQRALIRDGEIEHRLPPAYHGDPRRSEGALVFSEFGADLPERLAALGYKVVLHEVPVRGLHGEVPLLVFETQRL